MTDKFRKQAGMSQKFMANHLGVSSSYLSQIENGKKNPSFGFITKIAKTFKCRVVLDITPDNYEVSLVAFCYDKKEECIDAIRHHLSVLEELL